MNKKVLLRERKRHTARRVVSTPSVVLPGYPPRGGVPDLGTPPGGYLTWVPPGGGGGGYRTRVPPQGGTGTGYPPPPPGGGGYRTWVPPSPPGTPLPQYPPWGGTGTGYPPGGVPDLGTPLPGTLGGVPDPGTPPGGGGYRTRVPPRGGTAPGYPPGGVPDLGTPRGGTGPGYPPGGGYPDPPSPPPRCGQTNKVKLLPSRRTTYAGGNNYMSSEHIYSLKV